MGLFELTRPHLSPLQPNNGSAERHCVAYCCLDLQPTGFKSWRVSIGVLRNNLEQIMHLSESRQILGCIASESELTVFQRQ